MVNFNKFSNNYNEVLKNCLTPYGGDPAYFSKNKINLLKQFTNEHLPKSSYRNIDILEIGCGIGSLLPHFNSLERNHTLSAVDLSFSSLLSAKKSGYNVLNANALQLPFKNECFDTICFAGVIHHLPASLHYLAFKEAFRIVRRGGLLAIFEHNPLNPLTQWIVHNCEFDQDAQLILRLSLIKKLKQTGFKICQKQYTTFIPEFLKFLQPIESKLGWCFAGAQYFLGAVK